jgi:hypothetical protein
MKKIDMSPKHFRFRGMCTLIAVFLAVVAFTSCASVPENPAPPPPTTKILPVGFADAFEIIRSELKNDRRLVLHTIDTGGRFEARERTSGLIFFRHRTVIELILQEIGPKQAKVTMHLSAERYSTGGLTHPAGWYPSKDVDTFLGEDIMNLIEKKASEKVATEKTQ